MKLLRNCPINQLSQADDFFEAYIRCFTPTNGKQIVAIPGFVNGFFACELYLKMLTKNKAKGHDLKLLYFGLNNSQKSLLCSMYAKNPVDDLAFEDYLERVNKGFEFWRYIYEDVNYDFEIKHPFEYSEKFLTRFLPLLKQMAEDFEKTSEC